MTKEGIAEALTGDHHFEQAGFTALLKWKKKEFDAAEIADLFYTPLTVPFRNHHIAFALFFA